MTRKKLPVVTVAEGDEPTRLEGLPVEATVALADVAGSIREGLLALSCAAGLVVIHQIMQEELTAKLGPKGRHNRERPPPATARLRARSCSAAAPFR